MRILDLGFGGGNFLSYLLETFPILQPDLQFEVFGLDVTPWQLAERKGRKYLAERHPEIDWDGRLAIIGTEEIWPYSADFFDFIVSNQVMEHVDDHAFVLGEIRRCLRTDGLGINLFPVREVLWEGHALMPFVHRISDETARARVMWILAAMGFRGRYQSDRHERQWGSLRDFAREFSHVLEMQTNYITAKELKDLANLAGLEIDYSYTKDFYAAKLLSWAGKRAYKYKHHGMLEMATLPLAKRLASITVLLKKPPPQADSPGARLSEPCCRH